MSRNSRQGIEKKYGHNISSGPNEKRRLSEPSLPLRIFRNDDSESRITSQRNVSSSQIINRSKEARQHIPPSHNEVYKGASLPHQQDLLHGQGCSPERGTVAPYFSHFNIRNDQSRRGGPMRGSGHGLKRKPYMEYPVGSFSSKRTKADSSVLDDYHSIVSNKKQKLSEPILPSGVFGNDDSQGRITTQRNLSASTINQSKEVNFYQCTPRSKNEAYKLTLLPQQCDLLHGEGCSTERGTGATTVPDLSHFNIPNDQSRRGGPRRGDGHGLKQKVGSLNLGIKPDTCVHNDHCYYDLTSSRLPKGGRRKGCNSYDVDLGHFDVPNYWSNRSGPRRESGHGLKQKAVTVHIVDEFPSKQIKPDSSVHNDLHHHDLMSGHLPKGGRWKGWVSYDVDLGHFDVPNYQSNRSGPRRESSHGLKQKAAAVHIVDEFPSKQIKPDSSVHNDPHRHDLMSDHLPKGRRWRGYNSYDMGTGSGKPKRKRESAHDGRHPTKRRKTSEDEVDINFQWNLDDMKSVADKEFFQIVSDEQTVSCIHKSLRSHYGYFDPLYVTLFLTVLVNVLSPLASTSGSHHKSQAKQLIEHLNIFSSECFAFWGGLAMVVRKIPYSTEPKHTHMFVNKVSEFIEVLLAHDKGLDQMSFRSISIPFLPLDEFHAALKQIDNHGNDQFKLLLEKVGEFLHQRDKLRVSQLNLLDKQNKSCDRVSFIHTLLQVSNLSEQGISPYLRPNKKQGCFFSTHEYLCLHFELLKEDFLYPLRCALYHELLETDADDDRDYKKYSGVHLVGKDVSNFALVHKVKFILPHRRPVNWEHSKRLTFGSLICLSEDNFHTLIFGVITERKLEDLRKNIVSIRIIDGPDSLSQRLQTNAVYQMIESPVYLEAYVPVLERLKAVTENHNLVAFEKYLVNCKCEVTPPAYLQLEKETPRLLNLSTVVCECNELMNCSHKYFNVDVSDEKFWSDLETEVLDDSQKEALRLALTHELALIQGPPGTGKTFIGVKFVETLLRNRRIWTSQGFLQQPLVVMCYTNHALDQFLENILDLKRSKKISLDIVRVGGRSKSEALKEFNLRDKLIKRRGQKRHRHWHLKNQYSMVQAKYTALTELCETVDYCSVNEELYFSFLHPDELGQHEYHELRSQMESKEDLELREVLEWFNIITKVMPFSTENNQEVYTDSKAIEDDRTVATDNEEKSNGALVIDMAENGKEDLRILFKQLQGVETQECPIIRSRLSKLQLFKHCLKRRSRELEIQLRKLQTTKTIADKDEERLKVDILQRADVVGFTTTGASAHINILTKLYSKIVIIEEAAEIMEGQIIAALTNHTQHLVMIGDHKQLHPKAHDHTIGTIYGLEISMFERLINNKFPHATLKHQHRMRPEISQLVHPHIYPELYDHPSVCDYSPIVGVSKSVFFVSHEKKEKDTEDLKSPSNEHEASFVASLCRYLLQQGYQAKEITVLTPYIGQIVCMKKHFEYSNITGIRILPVDRYQGEENDIILLSLVRSEKPGFVKEDNRVCVALSRARKGLYCIGNFGLFARTSKLWREITKTLTEKNLLGTHLPLRCQLHQNENLVSSAAEFEQFIEGGCLEPCNTRLICGHVCPRMCHPFDPDIVVHPGECTKPCGRYCKAGVHQCKLKCNEVCQCTEKVEKKMPNCGHVQELPCDLDPSLHSCQEPCEKLLECGHPCRAKCGECCSERCLFLIRVKLPCGHTAQRECSETPIERMQRCQEECGKTLHCGHICSGTCAKCYQNRLHIPCTKRCERVLMCGHICKANCTQQCPPCKEKCPISCPHGDCGHICGEPCIKCAEPCEWKCPHHDCTKPCGEICDRQRCDKPCKRILPCGHKCIGFCKEPCPKVCRKCDPDHDDFQVFFGSEDDEDARFIQLKDCGHLIECQALDRWMDSSDSETSIQMKKCPKCKTVISCSPLRYCNSFKALKRDMNAIKEKSALYTQDEREQVMTQIKLMNESTNYFNKRFNEKSLQNFDDWRLQKHYISLGALSIEQNVKNTMNEIDSLLVVVCISTGECIQVSQLQVEYKRVKIQLKSLYRFVKSNAYKNLCYVPIQVSNDINFERRRLLLLFQCYLLQAYIVKHCIHLSPGDQGLINDMRKELNPENFKPCYQIQDESQYAGKKSSLVCIQKKYGIGGLSMKEMNMIAKAIDAKQGSWYRCRNGHLYNIGQCGGAMEEGICPECKSAIGGSHHRLLDSNTHDGTVDGSRHAAWSEGANMQNFDLNDLG